MRIRVKSKRLQKGPEYGTTEAAWKGVLVEADRLCDVHVRVRDELCNDVIQQVKQWQKVRPEYGTTEAAWKGVLVEADRLCDVHVRVRDELCNDVIQQVKQWQKALLKKMQDRVQKAKEG
ncbi:protein kinase C and casein kinase substrate in neurons protein 1-like [Diaphorina citri]|uniref:Protein kinase C and casein kinase substrate in neurons protein 1-like n=1 Tax=Diaphorina citri TaxID=121845 RepID=A0A1S3D612_DIACI|nr:protein kinase C and casein kinase substrate in neurons protein 1-like [Diaphorina citri]